MAPRADSVPGMSVASCLRAHQSCVAMGIFFQAAARAAGARRTEGGAAPPSRRTSRRVALLMSADPTCAASGLASARAANRDLLIANRHRSDRQSRISLDDLAAQDGLLPRLPERRAVDDPITERTAVGALGTLDRARDAHELGAHLVGGQAHLRVAVGAQVNEFQVRRERGVGQRVSAGEVLALRILEA